MKPVYIIAACLVALASAQIPPPIGPVGGMVAPMIPPIFPPMLGMGLPFPLLPFLGPFGPFGPLGLLGLGGLGGLGFGRFGGLGGLGGLGGIGGIGRFGLRGRRDVTKLDTPIKCSITTKSVDCWFGVAERMSCDVTPRLGEIQDSLKLRLVNLGVTGRVEDGAEFIELIAKKDEKFTFVHPSTKKPVLISLYWGNWNKPGFEFKDKTCWETLVKTVSEDGRDVKVDLTVF